MLIDHSFGAIRTSYINTIFIDPYSVDRVLDAATYIIFHLRLEFPEIVFALFPDADKFETVENDLFTGDGQLSSNLKTEKSDSSCQS
jgi:hypothetical protein